MRAGTWEPLLFTCQSSSVHVSLLGITMKKPNRPCFFPDDLKCPANVSPLNNRCAGPQAWADSMALSWEALWRWYLAGSGYCWARLKENLWLILSGHGSGQKLENCYRVTHLDPNWTVYSLLTLKANTRGGPPHRPTLSFHSPAHTCPFVCHSTMAPVLTSWHGLWAQGIVAPHKCET